MSERQSTPATSSGQQSDKHDSSCELPECTHRLCLCGHAECSHANENVQPNCSDCDCDGFRLQHGDTSPCIDREEQIACDWAFDAGDDSVGVSWCWLCKTCGAVDLNRDPPSDPDADAYERSL